MKLERCENMHLYPTDRYSECPFCSGLINENNMRLMLDGKFVNKKKVSLKKDENGVYIRPTEEKIRRSGVFILFRRSLELCATSIYGHHDTAVFVC